MPILDYLDQPERPSSVEDRVAVLERLIKAGPMNTEDRVRAAFDRAMAESAKALERLVGESPEPPASRTPADPMAGRIAALEVGLAETRWALAVAVVGLGLAVGADRPGSVRLVADNMPNAEVLPPGIEATRATSGHAFAQSILQTLAGILDAPKVWSQQSEHQH